MVRAMSETEDLLTPIEAARRLGITVRTLHRWEEAGFITAVRTPYGHRRYSPADIEKLLTRGQPRASA